LGRWRDIKPSHDGGSVYCGFRDTGGFAGQLRPLPVRARRPRLRSRSHYNASLISFDDLVGFPYPDPDGTGIRFLETPATLWDAQSVLIDEISRSKPEQQNRLFSLVHERKVQGLDLPRLRYRWAAMNPCSSDQDSEENYTGSDPLDRAGRPLRPLHPCARLAGPQRRGAAAHR